MAEPEAKTAASGEDSMEQILHSIRDIIADDKNGNAAAAAAPEEEILELTQVVTPEKAPDTSDALSNIDAALGGQAIAAPAPAPAAPVAAPADEFPPEQPVAAPAPQPQPQPAPVQEATPEPAPRPAPAAKKEHLVSDIPAQKTTAAIKELMSNIPKPKIESPNLRGGSTIEDLVVESLKPMLASWLDKNLPVIVQELVQKEIEKLIPHETRD